MATPNFETTITKNVTINTQSKPIVIKIIGPSKILFQKNHMAGPDYLANRIITYISSRLYSIEFDATRFSFKTSMDEKLPMVMFCPNIKKFRIDIFPNNSDSKIKVPLFPIEEIIITISD